MKSFPSTWSYPPRSSVQLLFERRITCNCPYTILAEHLGEWKKDISLVKRQTSQAFAVEFIQVPKEENDHVDWLAKATFIEHIMVSCQVLSFTQHSPAIEELKMQMIPKGVDWMTPIVSYLKNGTHPKDHNESWWLKVWASRFMLIRDVLYERGFPDHT